MQKTKLYGLMAVLILIFTACSTNEDEESSSQTTLPILDPSGATLSTIDPAEMFVPVEKDIELASPADHKNAWSNKEGVSLPSLEWECIDTGKLYDPAMVESLDVLEEWKNLDIVRIPLNQYCLVNDVELNDGSHYQQAVIDFIDNELASRDFEVIIDLHTGGPNNERTKMQAHMPNAQKSEEFWEITGEMFKDNAAVVAFELFNEPVRAFERPDNFESLSDAEKERIKQELYEKDWDCWIDGCMTEYGWQAAGMQALVDAARSSGAEQSLIVNGLVWANDVSGWLEHAPKDELNKIIVGFHVYDLTLRNDRSKWEEDFELILEEYPVIVTEFGERREGCTSLLSDSLVEWADEAGVSCTAWAWFPGGCGFPSIISDWNGTVTAQGAIICEDLGGPNCELPEVITLADVDSAADVDTVATCPISFQLDSGQAIQEVISCSNGVKLAVSGTDLTGWNGRLTSWEIVGDWQAEAYWSDWDTRSGMHLWKEGRSQYGGSGCYSDTGVQSTEDRCWANDRTQTITLYVDGPGSLEVWSDEFSGPSLFMYVIE